MNFDKYNNNGMKDKVGLHGKINILHFRNGMQINELNVNNLVPTVGKAQVAGLIMGGVSQAFTALAIGTGTAAPAAGDTALTAQAGVRASATSTRETTTVTNDTAQLVATFSFNAASAVTEAGIFDIAAAGTPLTHATFAAINVGSGDSLQLTYQAIVG